MSKGRRAPLTNKVKGIQQGIQTSKYPIPELYSPIALVEYQQLPRTHPTTLPIRQDKHPTEAVNLGSKVIAQSEVSDWAITLYRCSSVGYCLLDYIEIITISKDLKVFELGVC